MDRVRITKGGKTYEGILMPSNADYYILKLSNGYNIGIEKHDAKVEVIEEILRQDDDLEEIQKPIMILHTGGTIASKVDYETGAVIAGYKPQEILKRYPHLNVGAKFISNIQSEMMRFPHYNLIAKAILKQMENGTKAIILTHGTDTIHYTSAALGFILKNISIPVILVGSQRSSDRPSTDARLNLEGAVRFAEEAIKLSIGGVFIAMHHTTSDDKIAIIDGFHARKMHTSRRDAFKSIDIPPFAIVDENGIKFMREKKSRGNFKPAFFKDVKVGMIKTHPNMFPEQISCYKNFDGIIIEGTGLGHIPIDEPDELSKGNKEIYNALKELISKGVIVAIAPQTIYGRINLNVYSPQRRLKEMGIIGHLTNMTPETAFIKLAWLLSNYPKSEIKELYEKNMAGEIDEQL